MIQAAWVEKPSCPLTVFADEIDWRDKPTTIDQAAIEEALCDLVEPRMRLLHVGIGNSSLAQAVAGRCERLEGLSLSTGEIAYARSLAIANYAVAQINKYAADYSQHRGNFSLIIDNNPNSFACCWEHFLELLRGYRDALEADGIFVTHERGLSWVRRGLKPETWCIDGARFKNLMLAADFVAVERLGNGTLLARRRR